MSKDVEHINEPLSESFRDRIATIDEEGKRKWVYAYKPKGKFYSIRTWLSVFYFIVFFGTPFIQIDGRPLFMFNIPEGKFILFTKIFWPQDFFIFGLTMITFVFFVVLFTAAFGRLFCGWACPQTNFMEMMFRKIEFLILGDAPAQRQLSNAPWTGKKIFKVGLKHVVFYLLSFIIANFFLAYIIGMPALIKIITEPVSEHLVGFASILVFSAVFYGVYAFFREQACTVVCPYGRLQSVLLDKNSMIVAYDYKRGEPRGNAKKLHTDQLGDCIDCFQCVKVCPTGIDIRNGVQMECVGCTACIDACDNVMDKIGKPKGLIRYASENSIANGIALTYTSRMKFYTALCAIVLLILGSILATRKDVDATIIRTPGILYQERGTDSISNLYNIKVVNKTTKNVQLQLQLHQGNGKIDIIGKPYVMVHKEGQGSGEFFITLPKNAIKERSSHITIDLMADHKKIATLKTNFLGPVNN
ncbi:MAG: cytochrome c oxidase accessory protein CcoG [Hydrotalea sp. AMD]|uniref:cytochrome c oxidase accessory protein CcoG n=1 Tax=Hydrotalea sp. AMD TaxID=2501297 RepID=UPI0009444BC4|nr:cytochrome c oxidase accessory protein CcoG [Hydrotalea sp. AMD]RWZ88359.1 MAG: cytochrome c oxidase accessory protein CcoG [Hydrotalea sp. AMD]